jgi:hypothetical protein
MQKVYVVTTSEPMEKEVYVTVKATKKEAEKVIRSIYPNARKDDSGLCSAEFQSYACKNRDGSWRFMYIREVEI